MSGRPTTSTEPVARSPEDRPAAAQAEQQGEGHEEVHEKSLLTQLQRMETEEEEGEPGEYIEPGDDQLLPPPTFNPFFTLIEDDSNGEYYHPSVHYIFADDDQDVLVAAAMRSLASEPAPYPPSDDEGEPKDKQPRLPVLPQPRPGVKERYVLIDIGPDGQTVEDVQSLSPDWAVTATSITNAPTFEEDESSLGQGTALMLKIQGTGLSHAPDDAAKPDPADTLWDEAKSRCNGDMMASMSDIVERIKKSMLVLDKVTSSAPSQVQAPGE